MGRKRRCWEIKECIPHPDDAGNDEENPELSGIFTCEKKCTATRNCGRHVCGRICCPLAALTSLSDNAKGKRKQKEAPSAEELRELDPEGWHTCDLVGIMFVSLPPCSCYILFRFAINSCHAEITTAQRTITVALVHPAYSLLLKRYGEFFLSEQSDRTYSLF